MAERISWFREGLYTKRTPTRLSTTPGSPEPTQETWAHHFLPQFYLRGFGDEKKRIRRYERDRLQRRSIRGIKGVAVEVGFYTVISRDGNRSQAADDVLTRVEDASARAWRRLPTSFPPSREDRASIAQFIALQMLRTPERRREHNLMAEKTFEILTKDGAAESLLATISPPTIEAEIRMMLDIAPVVAGALLSKTWLLVRAANSSFITSDSPAALWSPYQENRLTGIGVNNAEEIHFPVDRKNSLVLMQPGSGPEGVIVLSPKDVHELNRMYAYESHRWIFQHPDDDILRADILPSKPRPLMGINQEEIFDNN